MKKIKSILTIAVVLFATSIYSQEQYPVAKIFSEMKDKLGIDSALIWLDNIDIDKNKLFTIDENQLLEFGKEMRSFGYVEEAILFFKTMTKFFPQSSVIWETLGSTYVRVYQKEEAIACYKKAIEINSENRSARGQLQMIDILLENTRAETREKMEFKPGENTGLKGSYLGQKLPEDKPELFAPGIVSVFGSNENTVTISPDGKEIYFGKESGIWVCKLMENGWTAPMNTGFQGYEMWISPKSGKMYYTGYEPGIWVMERVDDDWGLPKKIVQNGMFSTLTDDETLYTTVFDEKGKPNIGRYIKKEGKYDQSETLGPEINSLNNFDAHPNVAPDGSFIIFDSNRHEGKGLYIAFRNMNGSFNQAQFLGYEFKDGSLSTFSPDGKYLFFMKNRDIYWVSAKVVEELRPKE